MSNKQQKRRAKLFRQHKVPIIGPVTDVLSYGAVWIGMMNFLMIAITLYWTTLRPHMLRHVPWMNMGIFLAFLFAIVAILLLCVYKFIVPSYYEFRSKQYRRHGRLNTSNDAELNTSNDADLRGILESIDHRLTNLEKQDKAG